jgi:LacI family transcriptional regulator
LAWCFPKTGGSHAVGFDNQKSGYAIAEHVIAHGHRKLSVIAGLRDGNDRAQDRLLGIQGAINAHPEVRLLGLEECKYSFEEAGAALDSILSGPDSPTAVICGSDVLAVGAMLRARDLRLSIPKDISITGFDDINLARVTTPGLTTVRVPQDEMGRKAAHVLLGLLNTDNPHGHSFELMTTIINRGTLAQI